MLLLILSAPFSLAMGLPWGLAVFAGAILLATCNAVQEIKEEDKQEIRYNIISADDILREMRDWEAAIDRETQGKHGLGGNIIKWTKARLVVETGMAALVKKHAAELKRKKQDHTSSDQPLQMLEATYISLRLFPDDDSLVASALSLLSLVAKDGSVREKLLNEPRYTIARPIQTMRLSLQQAQQKENIENLSQAEIEKDQLSAELQRKGCLLLGALSDGHAELATRIVELGGLLAVIDAINWYQYHSGVVNWGLWCAFQLCYANMAHKRRLVSFDGVPSIVNVMRNCTEDLLVARHGIALLFDILREPDAREPLRVDVWQVRRQAVSAGVHDVLVAVMEAVRTIYVLSFDENETPEAQTTLDSHFVGIGCTAFRSHGCCHDGSRAVGRNGL